MGNQQETSQAARTTVELRDVRKAYGSTTALAGVDLDVHSGEIFALLGPNGAGKSTLVEICAGQQTCDSGNVTVLGVNPAHANGTHRARVGLISQATGTIDSLTVKEVLSHYAMFYPNPYTPKELVSMVGLTSAWNVRVASLSGGGQRRLDIALGIVGKPRLLFADEPTTGLDPEARRDVWDCLRQLSSSGTTILLTTHYMDEVDVLADRVAVLISGQIIETATPSTLGARLQTVATVSWRGVEGRSRVTTETPTAFVAALAESLGGEIPELAVERPSLEEIYLQLIDQKNADKTPVVPGTQEPQCYA